MSADFIFHCNSLRCRIELLDSAVVTTCSHIFCLPCAEEQNLSSSELGNRLCPACETRLSHPDDAVVTQLNPSEDYKTSILSGLGPTIIMECAGRALAFYTYQASQEITYQAYLAKSLTEKYSHKSIQLENHIIEANTEIHRLQNIVESSRKSIEVLENKNYELSDAFKEKNKALVELSHKYQSLKAQKMAAEVQIVASDDAEQTLHALTNQYPLVEAEQSINIGRVPSFSRRFHRHGGSRGPNTSLEDTTLGLRRTNETWQTRFHQPIRNDTLAGTPSGHRTRLPIPTHPSQSNHFSRTRTNPGSPNTTHIHPGFHSPTTDHRRGSTLSGYGLSAGAKVGSQASNRPTSHPPPRIRQSNLQFIPS